jgi:nitroimidazol reductase NimA-like FMN-containing flavoprotein (pyridoxamine 5'-phosphate oxidase superfamily)
MGKTGMRKKDREITDRHEIEKILTEATVLRLAINESGAPPYIVPVNFGYKDNAIYFHSSTEGKKMELIARDPRVSFEAEGRSSIIAPANRANACDWGAAYRSVIGQGTATILEDPNEKREGLAAIMAHYAPDIDSASFTFTDRIVEITAVVKIEIEEMTGKKNKV